MIPIPTITEVLMLLPIRLGSVDEVSFNLGITWINFGT